MEESTQHEGFETVKSRLEQIAEAVSDDNLPLDDALDLYEEAVALGLRVSDLVEDGIVVTDAEIGADSPLDQPEESHELAVPSDAPTE